ncbi:MAG: hypothetical protein H6739_09625 [Alphaproteobacteria bacterium]|nr:hypothetical protein [Alphaproteobacteria bacterium]
MPQAPDRDFKRRFVQALQDRPLDVEDADDRELWAQLHDAEHDPVTRLFDTIDFSGGDSIQLVMGFRGTGKTTEFSRLRRDLTEADFIVAHIDLDEYVDLRDEVGIADFLLLMTGAIREQLFRQKDLLPKEGFQASYWERAVGFLTQEVEVDELGVAFPGGVELKARLKGDQRLRQKLREQLASRLQSLVAEVHKLHQETLTRLDEEHKAHRGLVVILDSLEHLRGGGAQEDELRIRKSVEDLFLKYGRYLQLPDTHLVLSVPAFLMLKADELASEFRNGQVQAWTACRVRHPDGSTNQDAVDRMVTLIEKRGDWRPVLGERAQLDTLVLASGGYIRDLLNMMMEAVHLAGRVGPQDVAGKTIDRTRNAYGAVLREELDLLGRIGKTRNLSLVSTTEMSMVENFLDSHLLLPYRNDTFWYSVHPLIELGEGVSSA